jgi:hypothetical protein
MLWATSGRTICRLSSRFTWCPAIGAATGSEPSALVFYSAFNIAAHLALLRLLARIPGDAVTAQQREALWANIIIFLVCIPGAYALGKHGPWLLLLLIVSGWLSQLRRRHA